MELDWTFMYLAFNSVSWYVHLLVIVIGGGGFTLAFYLSPEPTHSEGFTKVLVAVYSVLLFCFAFYILLNFPDGSGLDSFPLSLSFNFLAGYMLIFILWFAGGWLITYIIRIVYVLVQKLFKKLNDIANSDEY